MKRTLASLALAGSIGLAVFPARPALADGAASTRNIILGGAAAVAGTLIIINHNKKVHQKEDEMARAQASAEEQANNSEAAYQAERRAYQSQVAINGEYKREVALQHQQIVALRREVAMETRRGDTFKSQLVGRSAGSGSAPRVATTSYGWGSP